MAYSYSENMFGVSFNILRVFKTFNFVFTFNTEHVNIQRFLTKLDLSILIRTRNKETIKHR